MKPPRPDFCPCPEPWERDAERAGADVLQAAFLLGGMCFCFGAVFASVIFLMVNL
jgi:hypothetical protein